MRSRIPRRRIRASGVSCGVHRARDTREALFRRGLTDVWQGPRGHSRGLENSASLEAPRHFPWHSAINNDAARPRSDRKVSAGAFGFKKFSIRGMPKLCNSERMLSFGIPGDTGMSAAVRRRTLPLGKFSHPPALAVAGIALPFPGQGRGPRGQSGPRELCFARGPPALPMAQRHQQRRSAPALRQKSERRCFRFQEI